MPPKLSNRSNQITISGFLFFIVALASLLPRALELGRFTVVDEVDWMQASANFYNALLTGEYQHTYQLEHPAVTTMWAGALGFMREFSAGREYKSGYVTSVNQLHTDLLRAGTSPLAVLVSGRLFVVLAITAGLLVAHMLIQPLVGRSAALVAALLLAFDPFYAGLSRLLHMDALLATFTLLYALSLTNYFFNQHKVIYLVIAGITAGLAALTKSPAVFLIPYTLVVLALAWRQARTRKDEGASLINILKALVWMALIGMVVFIACWPAMWVAPLQTINKIIQGALFYAEQGHISLLFFNGRVSNGADFPLSFYPLTFLWRTTPVVVLGLAAALVAAWRRWGLFADRQTRWLALNLLLLSLGFMAFMHLGAKKFDRYILPAHLPLDVIAALGWCALVGRFTQARPWLEKALLFVIATFQFSSLASVFPYMLSYYNPLMGGPQKAPQVMMIGWGEGLDQAAAYLNHTPESGKLTVTSAYGIGPLSFYFNRQFIHEPNVLNMENEWGPQNADKLRHSDYVVVYINQWQRGYVRPLLDLLDTVEPEYTVVINHIEYARLYRLADLPQPAYQELLDHE